jgi:hypothetical protein
MAARATDSLVGASNSAKPPVSRDDHDDHRGEHHFDQRETGNRSNDSHPDSRLSNAAGIFASEKTPCHKYQHPKGLGGNLKAKYDPVSRGAIPKRNMSLRS